MSIELSIVIPCLNEAETLETCIKKANDFLHLEMPKYGGHVGFIQKGKFYYNEKRALEFFNINQN